MAKKIIFSLIVLGLIISFGIFSCLTFNPITNYYQIQQTKAILTKIKIYDNHQSAPPPKTRNLSTWQVINFDKTENNFMEKTGFTAEINSNNEYLGILSSGFDNTIVYNYSQDCWYSQHIKIVSLAICKN